MHALMSGSTGSLSDADDIFDELVYVFAEHAAQVVVRKNFFGDVPAGPDYPGISFHGGFIPGMSRRQPSRDRFPVFR
jgi:hypothetical protein